MVVYLFTCLLATLVVWGMSRRFPTLNLEERAVKKHKGERAGMIDEFARSFRSSRNRPWSRSWCS